MSEDRLDETKRIMGRLANTPPQPHKPPQPKAAKDKPKEGGRKPRNQKVADSGQ